jgi:hypothetical protein
VLTLQDQSSTERAPSSERQWSIRTILFATAVIALQTGLLVNNLAAGIVVLVVLAPAGTMRLLRHGLGWSNRRLIRFARYYSLAICVGLPFLACVLLCIANRTVVTWFGIYCIVVGASGALASIVYYYWILFHIRHARA